jgi:hypothetical protein
MSFGDIFALVNHMGENNQGGNSVFDLVEDQDNEINFADLTELIVTIMKVRFGDSDLDHDVDPTDLAVVGLNWAPSATDKTWNLGDFDGDGNVDAVDLAALNLNWAPSGY